MSTTSALSWTLPVLALMGWLAVPSKQARPANPVDPAILSEINEQVWIPFCESFASRDADVFLSLHTEDVVRVAMDQNDVRSGSTFHEKTARNMQASASSRSGELTLHFLQRNHGEDAAFERGVYRYESLGGDHVSHGEFYVLLRKSEGRWRIALDADRSSDAASFEAARPMTDVEWE